MAALIKTLSTLKGATNKNKVLIAKVPARESDAAQLRAALEKNGIPLFKNDIPLWLKQSTHAGAEEHHANQRSLIYGYFVTL